MNPKLKEINELIALCDQMLLYIQERGDIRPNNDLYCLYTVSYTHLDVYKRQR